MLAKTRKRFEKLENDVRVIGTNLGRLMVLAEAAATPTPRIENRLDTLERGMSGLSKGYLALAEHNKGMRLSFEPGSPNAFALVGKHVHVTILDDLSAQWGESIAAAVERGCKAMDVAGTRVGYAPEGKAKWIGTVVPTPVYARSCGNTGEAFIYVVKDGTHSAVGCYVSRLVRM